MAGDYYDILGVSRDVDAKELKSAYRRKVMEYHPDRNPDDAGAESKFKAASEAYEVLSDTQKRAAYDRYGEAALNNGRFGGGRSPEDIFSDVFGDVFSEFFSSGSRRRGESARGGDLRHDAEISLEEAFAGSRLDISFPGKVNCESCAGSGAKPGTRPETCPECAGSGRVRLQQGFFTMESSCRACHGRGKLVRSPCSECRGAGMVSRKRRVKIDIPPGIDNGQRIRCEGKGEPGPQGGPLGDLYVFVSIREHKLFRRKGAHLYTRASIPMSRAALGGEIRLPGIDGSNIVVKIAEGSQTGRKIKISGHGMPTLRGRGRGDLLVELFVETPRRMTARQKELLREFDDDCNSLSHPESASFMDRVRTFFDRGSNGASV